MPNPRAEETYLQEIINALADSGRCGDLWDIQKELVARGHSGADVSKAVASAEYRSALEERCSTAQRNLRRDTSQLIAQPSEARPSSSPSPLLDDDDQHKKY